MLFSWMYLYRLQKYLSLQIEFKNKTIQKNRNFAIWLLIELLEVSLFAFQHMPLFEALTFLEPPVNWNSKGVQLLILSSKGNSIVIFKIQESMGPCQVKIDQIETLLIIIVFGSGLKPQISFRFWCSMEWAI